jgi:hypothetical protein
MVVGMINPTRSYELPAIWLKRLDSEVVAKLNCITVVDLIELDLASFNSLIFPFPILESTSKR